MSAIVTALRSTTITRLKLTYEELPRDVKNKIEQMEAFLNPRDNLNVYEAASKGSNNLLVPVLGKHVTY